jgi:hypothetical protein
VPSREGGEGRADARRDGQRPPVDAPRMKDNRGASGDAKAAGEARAPPRFAIPTRALGLVRSIRPLDGLVWQRRDR